jgi:hypothetical protein
MFFLGRGAPAERPGSGKLRGFEVYSVRKEVDDPPDGIAILVESGRRQLARRVQVTAKFN